jgi:hypothetical protein
MTPNEKAIELVKKFDKLLPCEGTTTAQTPIDCALISVNEILFTLNEVSEEDNSTYAYHTAIFYNQVKTELKKL